MTIIALCIGVALFMLGFFIGGGEGTKIGYLKGIDDFEKTLRAVREKQEHTATTIVKRTEEQIRDSERNHIFSVMRSLGIKFDQSAVIKLHRQWMASAEAEAQRKLSKNDG